jgi:1-acyl-sn-glycerol-3-phosphate acyltransferase
MTRLTGKYIPFPQFHSWLHERIAVPRERYSQVQARWTQQTPAERVGDAIISRIFKFIRYFGSFHQFVPYKIVAGVFQIYLRIFHRLRVFGLHNIPKQGAIFYVNHPSQIDPLILMASLPFQISGLIAWGRGWLADMFEYKYGLISLRGREMHVNIERIIRQILLKNRYFAIWPEGHPTYSQQLEEGQSGIIRVYSALNYDGNRIPFVPVLIRGAEVYLIKESHSIINPPKFRLNPIETHFFPPIWIPREWLQPLEQQGKPPREIIDYLMHHLAAKQGQRYLTPNRIIEYKRKKYASLKKEK